jgi:hypothetical protein
MLAITDRIAVPADNTGANAKQGNIRFRPRFESNSAVSVRRLHDQE